MRNGAHAPAIRRIAVTYYLDVTLLDTWCGLKNDFRYFRIGRISDARLLDERFIAESGKLMAEWLALPKRVGDLTVSRNRREFR
jgi:predicted DNA-binding transcriptional regulator YafY